MRESTALKRLRPGHLVARAIYHRHRPEPHRHEVVRVVKAERGRVKAGGFWFDREGRCLKPRLKSRIRPLTAEIREELAETLTSSPWAKELAELGADQDQFTIPEGPEGLLAGDIATYVRPDGSEFRDLVSSVTARFIYIGDLYFDRATGSGKNSAAKLQG